MPKYLNVEFYPDTLNRPNINDLIQSVKSKKGEYLKNKIDFRYLNKLDKLENIKGKN